jgi:glycosyltransferase involved in cell wall biosynthesis
MRKSMRVLRVYHGGRSADHRARERALIAAGADISLAVPATWPEPYDEAGRRDEFPIIELPIVRAGDVNRHAYGDTHALRLLIEDVRPDVLDLHEEPFSIAARQWLAAAPVEMPVVMYTAQNVDKRFPPPFAQYERTAHRRAVALYPCSGQAASVARGKGFSGLIEVLPLGYDDAAFTPGSQSLDDDEIVLALIGRLVPEKGVTDAVRILAVVHSARSARLMIVGSGPEEPAARAIAAALGVADRVQFEPWQSTAELAAAYRGAHVVLVPSSPTTTWVEQFGRVIVEAQASGAVVAGYASGSIPEVAGEAGVLTDVGAASRLAERIVELAADAADFAGRREQGIRRSTTRTWTRVAEAHADLYRRVAAGDIRRVGLPRSPQKRRAIARAEFGATAATTAGTRPFALPLLRRGGTTSAVFAKVLDGTAELAARLDESRPTSH